ncbi:MAG TPA: hypothetical protein PK307_04355 [Spirochaetota bacterium]|nr:hypothetical protein [Spirochaetota bacterium]HOD15363.1 hypothetical protein [Spirochaetota bacterium]HPN14356.1 hypothetical protein [Spirochaetota bacterium]HQL81408.1 hypothetical protein [Spirochaetota bacterium]
MDGAQRNRVILAIIVVPAILLVLYLVLGRLIGFAFVFLYDTQLPFMNFRLMFCIKNAIVAGAGFWIMLYAYAYVRYGELKLGLLKFGKKE